MEYLIAVYEVFVFGGYKSKEYYKCEYGGILQVVKTPELGLIVKEDNLPFLNQLRDYLQETYEELIFSVERAD